MIADNLNDKLFYQRLDELAERCVTRYCPQFTHFLDERNLRITADYIEHRFSDVLCISYGGFSEAERRVVGLFPREIYNDGDIAAEEFYSQFDLGAVYIGGSSFTSFSHRDVMGAVLSLGVKREAVGDIYVPQSGDEAFVCLSPVAAKYVAENLESVAKDRVRTKIIRLSELPVIERKFSVISGTVASERLDCVLSLALKVSREKAKQFVVSGVVSLNHIPETRIDCKVLEGDLLSVRGYGRFRISELGDITRKGRNRAIIHKYI